MTAEQVLIRVQDLLGQFEFEMHPMAALQKFMNEAAGLPDGLETMDADPMVISGISDTMLQTINAYRELKRGLQGIADQVKAEGEGVNHE